MEGMNVSSEKVCAGQQIRVLPEGGKDARGVEKSYVNVSSANRFSSESTNYDANI